MADLYKTEVTIPIAFYAAKLGTRDLGRSTRLLCRDAFRRSHLLKRVVPDIREALGDPSDADTDVEIDHDPALPTDLWEPPEGLEGGELRDLVILILKRTTPSLRGELSRWMIEPQAGVFVGNISALVRDKLWQYVLEDAPDASAMMLYGAQTEQGFTMRCAGDDTRGLGTSMA